VRGMLIDKNHSILSRKDQVGARHLTAIDKFAKRGVPVGIRDRFNVSGGSGCCGAGTVLGAPNRPPNSIFSGPEETRYRFSASATRSAYAAVAGSGEPPAPSARDSTPAPIVGLSVSTTRA